VILGVAGGLQNELVIGFAGAAGAGLQNELRRFRTGDRRLLCEFAKRTAWPFLLRD
jgi:hypothetical protein